jgi:hypothetical protein
MGAGGPNRRQRWDTGVQSGSVTMGTWNDL